MGLSPPPPWGAFARAGIAQCLVCIYEDRKEGANGVPGSASMEPCYGAAAVAVAAVAREDKSSHPLTHISSPTFPD